MTAKPMIHRPTDSSSFGPLFGPKNAKLHPNTMGKPAARRPTDDSPFGPSLENFKAFKRFLELLFCYFSRLWINPINFRAISNPPQA
ncbi:hypothetical protein HAX54_008352, partial [Datura stramonium]|nr:hypothetical protein [Datura stramonium]